MRVAWRACVACWRARLARELLFGGPDGARGASHGTGPHVSGLFWIREGKAAGLRGKGWLWITNYVSPSQEYVFGIGKCDHVRRPCCIYQLLQWSF